jgi:hypothetical protein
MLDVLTLRGSPPSQSGTTNEPNAYQKNHERVPRRHHARDHVRNAERDVHEANQKAAQPEQAPRSWTATGSHGFLRCHSDRIGHNTAAERAIAAT